MREQKEKYRIEQNEIKAKLERDLIGVQEKKEATKKRLDEECEKELALEQKNHEEHVRLKTLANRLESQARAASGGGGQGP